MDNLNAKAANKNTNANTCNGVLCNNAGSSEKLMVPVAPYTKEIPNNKIPEENAEDNIIFTAASDDILFCRSKLAMAATGMEANSSDKKNISKFPLDIKKNIPSKADNNKIKNSAR